ncbi:MAG: hypothetical protein WCT04_17060 [Planctomycetota bacterium]
MNFSFFRSVFKFLASLQLAMILIGVIVIASIAGTLYESKFNSDVARDYIYDAPWFNMWLSVLCVNLFCVAAIRYPWKSYQTGFVITHAGIITLLIGAMIDRTWGIEGYLHLTRGAEPTSTMELHTQELRVYAKGIEEFATTTFRVKSMTTEAKRRFTARTPDDGVKVNVLDVKAVQQATEIEPSPKGNPAITFTLRGPMMGQNAMSLFLGEKQNLGRAIVSFSKGLPPATAVATDSGKVPESASDVMVPRLERGFVFSKQNEPMIKTIAGEPSGINAKLMVDPSGTPSATFTLSGKTFTVAIRTQLKKETAIEGMPEWKIIIHEYFPNFHFDDDKAGTIDDKPDNPAIIFELRGPLIKESAVAKPIMSPHGAAAHGNNPADAAGGEGLNGLAFYLGADGKLRYVAKSRLKGESSGEVVNEHAVSLGWGPGAEFVVDNYIEKAMPKLAWKQMPGEFNPDNPQLGLLCRVTSGSQTKEVWVGKTPVDDMRLTTVEINGKTIDLAFSNSTSELPFSVSLLKFDAPRHEGLEESTTFMEFKSILGFEGEVDSVQLKTGSKTATTLKRVSLEGAILEITTDEMRFQQSLPAREPIDIPLDDVVTYERRSQEIAMNHPTTYPISSIAPWFGTNYKFSQAGHNFPSNPDYSGVQVLRDPGWALEWFGSLMICFGIFTMFYLKPYFRRTPVAPATPNPTVELHENN